MSKELYQNGPSQSYNLSVRGGTDVVSYFLSGNYDDDEGMIWYNTHEAFRLRANVGVVFNELFSLDVSTGYVDGDTRFMQHVPGQGGEWTDMQWGNGYCQPRINPGAAGCEFTKGFQEHLPSDAEKIRTTREFNRFTGSATLNFTEGLALVTNRRRSRQGLGRESEHVSLGGRGPTIAIGRSIGRRSTGGSTFIGRSPRT